MFSSKSQQRSQNGYSPLSMSKNICVYCFQKKMCCIDQKTCSCNHDFDYQQTSGVVFLYNNMLYTVYCTSISYNGAYHLMAIPLPTTNPPTHSKIKCPINPQEPFRNRLIMTNGPRLWFGTTDRELASPPKKTKRSATNILVPGATGLCQRLYSDTSVLFWQSERDQSGRWF